MTKNWFTDAECLEVYLLIERSLFPAEHLFPGHHIIVAMLTGFALGVFVLAVCICLAVFTYSVTEMVCFIGKKVYKLFTKKKGG